MKAQMLVLFLIAVLAGLQLSSAQTISVQTSKSIYNYGDHLSVAISVSKITGNNAIMYIVDSDGTKSSAIPVQIKNQNTTITTPIPFNSELFREGKYQIQIEYDGAKSSTPFELVDAGNLVMPFGSNVIVPQWIDDTVTDYMFFKFLVEKKVIDLPDNQKIGGQVKIPDWYKINGKWWVERKITDSEFVKGLQYLVNQKIIEL
ncbi:MAG: hypothetical protein ACT4OD_07030 [Candidatus Nitrosotenuis sp.]